MYFLHKIKTVKRILKAKKFKLLKKGNELLFPHKLK